VDAATFEFNTIAEALFFNRSGYSAQGTLMRICAVQPGLATHSNLLALVQAPAPKFDLQMGTSPELKKSKHFKLLRRPRSRALQRLNNLVFMNNLLAEALRHSEEEEERGTRETITFSAPSKSGASLSTRTRQDVISMLRHARNRGLYEQALLTAVALTEEFLVTYVRIILRSYPQKLTANVAGASSDKNIDLESVLAASTLADLHDHLIERHLANLFYKAPRDYLLHIERILGITIVDATKQQYIEIKASRDLIIHNASIINRAYCAKAGAQARGNHGDQLSIDQQYFNDAIIAMKTLITGVYSQVLATFGNADLKNT